MSKVLITKEKLDHLANCVSAKSGESIPLTIDEMAEAVLGIQEGGIVDNITTLSGGGSFHDISSADTTVLGTKTITENGTYNASSDNLDGYSSVTVNASGGSSDFSTATVTVINNSDAVIEFNAVYIEDDFICTVKNVLIDNTAEMTVVLYKNDAGETYVTKDGFLVTPTSASGNVTINGNFLIITGDCTVTYS